MDWINSVDIHTLQYFVSIRNDFLTIFFDFFTTIFNASWNFLIILFLVTFLIIRSKGYRKAMVFVGSILVSAGFIYALKVIFGVDRPSEPMMHVFGNSFPSYHAGVSVVFLFLIVYLYGDGFSYGKRALCYIVASIFVIFVAVSRLYLGVHWLSDVVGGVVIGFALFYTATLFLKNISKR
jgi:undecaprenyl-diphosphatase